MPQKYFEYNYPFAPQASSKIHLITGVLQCPPGNRVSKTWVISWHLEPRFMSTWTPSGYRALDTRFVSYGAQASTWLSCLSLALYIMWVSLSPFPPLKNPAAHTLSSSLTLIQKSPPLQNFKSNSPPIYTSSCQARCIYVLLAFFYGCIMTIFFFFGLIFFFIFLLEWFENL